MAQLYSVDPILSIRRKKEMDCLELTFSVKSRTGSKVNNTYVLCKVYRAAYHCIKKEKT